MAAPWDIVKKNEDFRFMITLRSFLTGRILDNPTLAAGDWKISKDGGAFANLSTLPSAVPASGCGIQVDASSTEFNCDVALIVGRDQTVPPEWDDVSFSFRMTP